MNENSFEYIARLDEEYAVKIYSFCKMMLAAQGEEDFTYYFSPDELEKNVLGINEMLDESDLKNLIQPAVDQVNSETDITISYEGDEITNRFSMGKLFWVVKNKPSDSPDKIEVH